MIDNIYIFTEIVNCGKIGRIALDSFHKYHNYKVYIYGTKTDFEHIKPNDNNNFIEVDTEVLGGYKRGHIGTALLWEKVIKNCETKYVLHFDSDVIFRQNMVDSMIDGTSKYDIIGPIRNYAHNPHNMKHSDQHTDLCQTNCTLFNIHKISSQYLTTKKRIAFLSLEKISKLSLRELARRIKWFVMNTIILRRYHLSVFAQMIYGTYSPFIFPTIDFFDPVMFDMVANGAKIYHLDFNEVGGCDTYGKRDNMFKDINNFPTPYKLDFGSKLVHFSCVGSGMNFYNNKVVANRIGGHYVECALDRYALFCKTFYNETLPGIPLDKYEKIFTIKEWY